jgi:excisionase family DNA binding protein
VLKISGVGQQREAGELSSPRRVVLSEVMQTWRLRRLEFAALINASLAHELSCWKSSEGKYRVGDISFERVELQKWLDTFRLNCGDTYSVDQAAKLLGIKQQVAYELVRNGFLEAVASNDSVTRGVRVATTAIEDFRERFVPLSELAKLRGVQPRKLLSQLATKPACGPAVDGVRQYFYRRDEVNTAIGTPGSAPSNETSSVL